MNEDSLHALAAEIPAPCEATKCRTSDRLNRLTKPQGSLGRLEELARNFAAMRGVMPRTLGKRCVVVMAADHGVVAEGVSAFPQEVTPQMVLNFLRGGAAINVLARHAGADVVVVDAGVAGDLPTHPELISQKIGRGTANFAMGPAMTRAQAVESLALGIEIANSLADQGYELVGTGEMGIGNTTAASAITAVLTHHDPDVVTGRGTGIDDAGLDRKVTVINRALAVNKPNADDALDVLSKVGGFEIGGLAGVIIGCAARRIPVIIDGFISGAAALVAVSFAPRALPFLLAAHRSAEPGHRLTLESLNLTPLFEFDLRLGEGTGAALAMPVVEASIRILNEMATFNEAGVSEKSDVANTAVVVGANADDAAGAFASAMDGDRV